MYSYYVADTWFQKPGIYHENDKSEGQAQMSDNFSASHCSFEWFEWDENKRLINLDRHGIDFEDAAIIFDAPYLVKRSDRDGETRFLAIGLFEGIEIVVIYTERKEACRIISARRGRVNERRAYRAAFP